METRKRNKWLDGNELERAASARISERGYSSQDAIALSKEQGISYKSAIKRLSRGRPFADTARSEAAKKAAEHKARIAADAAAAVDARKAEIAARMKDEEEE